MVYVFDQQLDVFGGAHDIAPTHERMRLFEAPRTIVGQMPMNAPIESRVIGDPLAGMRRQLSNYAIQCGPPENR